MHQYSPEGFARGMHQYLRIMLVAFHAPGFADLVEVQMQFAIARIDARHQLFHSHGPRRRPGDHSVTGFPSRYRSALGQYDSSGTAPDRSISQGAYAVDTRAHSSPPEASSRPVARKIILLWP